VVSLPTILLILAGLSIGATVIAALMGLRSAREARGAIFPIVREEETIRARRARIATFLLSAMTALFLGGWLATLRLSLPVVTEPETAQLAPGSEITFVTETPTVITQPAVVEATPTQLPPVRAAVTDTPPPPATVPFISTPEQAVEAATIAQVTPTQPPPPTPLPPTATLIPPTVIPSPTASPLPPTATITPTSLAEAAQIPTPAPRTPAPSGVRMGPIEFATDITPDINAVNPGYFFPQKTGSVYAVYQYSGMVDGVDFAAVWYQNGAELWRDEQKWRWGSKAQFYSFLNPPGQGLYKL
jgi:hypothetical protein